MPDTTTRQAKSSSRGTSSRTLLPFSQAEAVRKKFALTQEEFADLLGIDHRTYARRSEGATLNLGESLQVEMLNTILNEATRVFRDEDLARSWMHSPINSLNNERPFDHLVSIEGYERVKDALGKIEFGMY